MTAAVACFAGKGCSGCSMQEIADRAGMSTGALYVYYDSKEALFKEMIHIEHGLAIKRTNVALAQKTYLNGIIWFISVSAIPASPWSSASGPRRSLFPVETKLLKPNSLKTTRSCAISG